MPDFYVVGSRRHIGQFKSPGVVRYRKIWILRRNQPSVHPAVDVALHLNDFGFVHLNFQGLLKFWLSLIKRGIDLTIGVDVMENAVRIENFYRAAGWEGQNVWMVLALLLIQGDFLRLDLLALFDIANRNHRICEIAVIH